MERAQTYVERAPLAALAGQVRTLWVQHTGGRPYVQRNLPTGGVELQCTIGGLARVVGTLTTANIQVFPPHTTVVGARFWPGAASSLLGSPAGELVDSIVPMEDLWAGRAAQLAELLGRAPDSDAAVERLQDYLVCRQSRAHAPDPIVLEAVRRLAPWRSVEISRLTTQLAISASQLRRRFQVAVGVGPKTVQRTLRFQGYLALSQAAASSTVSVHSGSLADLAVAAGYADHAHLSRECVRLTGLTPRALLGSGQPDRCGCGHDHAASFTGFLVWGGLREQVEDARFVQARDTARH